MQQKLKYDHVYIKMYTLTTMNNVWNHNIDATANNFIKINKDECELGDKLVKNSLKNSTYQ